MSETLHLDPALIPEGLTVLYEGKWRSVIEEAPTTRLVMFHGAMFQLSFPYVYFATTVRNRKRLMDFERYNRGRAAAGLTPMVSHHGAQFPVITNIFCSPVPVREMDQRLCKLPVPNLLQGHPCYNWTAHPLKDDENYTKFIIAGINDWWLGGMNNDWFPTTDPVVRHLVKKAAGAYNAIDRQKFFAEWEKLSPQQVLKLPYQQLSTTMRSLTRTRKSSLKVGASA